MDKASLIFMAMRVLAATLCIALVTACGSAPPEKKAVAVSTPAPLTPQPVEIQKPVNVSFSTYSTEWPVDWQWIDPDERNDPTPHDVRSGVLRITVNSKKDLFGDKRNAPRYLKAIKGDFQIETRVRFTPKENYQGAGLLVFKDENNYLSFERAYGGRGGGGARGVDPRARLAPGEVDARAGGVRGRRADAPHAERGVAGEPGGPDARQRPRGLRERPGAGAGGDRPGLRESAGRRDGAGRERRSDRSAARERR